MKLLLVAILTLLMSFSLNAKKSVSLNEAVKQAGDQGRVISARTINDKHEVKVLTPSGSVKTININAGENAKVYKQPRSDRYNRAGQSMRYRHEHPLVPESFSNKMKQRTIKLDTGKKVNSQSATRQRSGSKNDSKKDK